MNVCANARPVLTKGQASFSCSNCRGSPATVGADRDSLLASAPSDNPRRRLPCWTSHSRGDRQGSCHDLHLRGRQVCGQSCTVLTLIFSVLAMRRWLWPRARRACTSSKRAWRRASRPVCSHLVPTADIRGRRFALALISGTSWLGVSSSRVGLIRFNSAPCRSRKHSIASRRFCNRRQRLANCSA